MSVYTWIWLGAMVFFLLFEAGTVALVSLWFAAGALVAAVFSLTGIGFTAQLLIFLLVSAALLAMLRPLAQKYIRPRIVRTNVDSVIGSVGIVTEQVDNIAATGQVKLGSMTWTARSTNDSVIPPQTRVRADRIEGVKVFVTPVQTPSENS